VDLFAEDRAHEQLLCPLTERLARDHARPVQIRVRSARGGHGRALAELKLYQQGMLKGIGGERIPDLLVVAIDANCKSYAAAQREIQETLTEEFRGRAVAACPDPHIERWYLADLDTFHQVVGIRPSFGEQKCERGVYKQLLAEAVIEA